MAVGFGRRPCVRLPDGAVAVAAEGEGEGVVAVALEIDGVKSEAVKVIH